MARARALEDEVSEEQARVMFVVFWISSCLGNTPQKAAPTLLISICILCSRSHKPPEPGSELGAEAKDGDREHGPENQNPACGSLNPERP